MNVNRYNFDSIVSKTQKEITPIRKGKEDEYAGSLNLLERKILSIYKRYHINGRQTQEIIQVVLLDIKGILDHEDYDCSRWCEPCYRECADELEALFLPDLNQDLKKLIAVEVLDSGYFELARKCLVKIHDSIGLWTKEYGADGYFNFIGRFVFEEHPITDQAYLVEDKYLS